MVGRQKEEASQPPEVLAGKGVIDRGKEVVGRPPEVLAGQGFGLPAQEGRQTATRGLLGMSKVN